VDDPRMRMAEIADVDLTGGPWWWLRIPDSGPVAEDLSKC
jgi:hypothetical protein